MKPFAVAMCALLLAPGTALAAGVNKCVIDGKTVYSDRPCPSAGTSLDIQAKPPPPAKREYLQVSAEVVKRCYDMYRVHSLDPTDAKMLWSLGFIADAGFPVLNVEVVFRNKAGGPERDTLWCKLTPDLKIDEAATSERVMEKLRRRMGL